MYHNHAITAVVITAVIIQVSSRSLHRPNDAELGAVLVVQSSWLPVHGQAGRLGLGVPWP